MSANCVHALVKYLKDVALNELMALLLAYQELMSTISAF